MLRLLCRHCPHLLHHLNLLNGRIDQFLLSVLLKLSLNRRVPVILHIIVRSSRQVLGNVRPAIAVMLMHCNEDGFFIVRPFSLFELRVQMIDESFSALLPLSPWKMCRNLGPLSPVESTLFSQNLILFSGPRPLPLDDGWTGQRLILTEAFHSGPIRKVGCNLIPSWCRIPVLFGQLFEQFRLFVCPRFALIGRFRFGLARTIVFIVLVVLILLLLLLDRQRRVHSSSSRRSRRSTYFAFLQDNVPL